MCGQYFLSDALGSCLIHWDLLQLYDHYRDWILDGVNHAPYPLALRRAEESKKRWLKLRGNNRYLNVVRDASYGILFCQNSSFWWSWTDYKVSISCILLHYPAFPLSFSSFSSLPCLDRLLIAMETCSQTHIWVLTRSIKRSSCLSTEITLW